MTAKDTEHHAGTILLVDDEDAVLEVLSRALEEIGGYEVICASDGCTALEKLESSRIDIVITDLQMPNMNGLQLIEHLVTAPSIIPVIAMSGGSNQSNPLQDAQQLGAAASLLKPISVNDLLEAVATYMPD